MTNKDFMLSAINEAEIGIKKNHGGPFGAIVVKDGKIIASAHNMVLKKNDATCHGEVEAIRSASKKLKTFDLSGTTLYTTSEPCPMCLTACMWANVNKVYYGCDLQENEKIGFRDLKFDKVFGGRIKSNYLEQICHKECQKLFKDYIKLNRQRY